MIKSQKLLSGVKLGTEQISFTNITLDNAHRTGHFSCGMRWTEVEVIVHICRISFRESLYVIQGDGPARPLELAEHANTWLHVRKVINCTTRNFDCFAHMDHSKTDHDLSLTLTKCSELLKQPWNMLVMLHLQWLDTVLQEVFICTMWATFSVLNSLLWSCLHDYCMVLTWHALLMPICQSSPWS